MKSKGPFEPSSASSQNHLVSILTVQRRSALKLSSISDIAQNTAVCECGCCATENNMRPRRNTRDSRTLLTVV